MTKVPYSLGGPGIEMGLQVLHARTHRPGRHQQFGHKHLVAAELLADAAHAHHQALIQDFVGVDSVGQRLGHQLVNAVQLSHVGRIGCVFVQFPPFGAGGNQLTYACHAQAPSIPPIIVASGHTMVTIV